jgi:outer membrane protein assembly factor BamB
MLIGERSFMQRTFCGIMLAMLLAGMLIMTYGHTIAELGGPKNIKSVEATDVSVAQTTDWWPMFHHDVSHAGYSASKAPSTNNTIWNDTIGSYVYSSPAVADGRVYVGSLSGDVDCLDALTGKSIWYRHTDSRVYSSPAVAYGKVYIGSNDGHVYCFDASTGVNVWNYATHDVVYSSPAVADGKVFIGSNNHNVSCLNASTGTLIWNYTTGDIVQSSPAVVDGKVYIGSNDGHVYCLDASTGTHIWNYTTGGDLWSSPAVADGKVYVGSDDARVYCLDALSGDQIWNYTTGSSVYSSPAVADGRVYVGSNDDHAYCLNASTGMQVWNCTTGGSVQSSPAVAEGKVFFGSDDMCVYCLDASTGTQIWKCTTGGYAQSSPAVADGIVYMASSDGTIYAIEDAYHDVAVTNVTLSKTVVGQNYSVFINVTLQNQGTFNETFNVTAYCDWPGGEIGQETVADLPLHESRTINFTWDTTGFAKKNYTISVYAERVTDETNTTDNFYNDGWVKVTIPGDVTEDELIWADMQDIDILIAAFMSSPGADGKYWHTPPCQDCPHSPNCDVNNDLSIDMADIQLPIDNFMTPDP